MKISNKAKDYIVVTLICVVVIWLLSGAMWWVASLFAEEITVDSMNKYYAEQTIQNEMNYLAMKHYMDNISEEEFAETFFKGE